LFWHFWPEKRCHWSHLFPIPRLFKNILFSFVLRTYMTFGKC
jgi:hypothetical protein